MVDSKHRWTEADIPDQQGRTVLITGANSGLGLRSAHVLTARGARVLLACRSSERGERALRSVQDVAGEANPPELVLMDLANLSSIRAAASQIRQRTGDVLDLLLNNAGLMGTPKATTADGFESQFGINHLGHAALTWLLMPALRGGSAARVVTVSSVAAMFGTLNVTDPNYTRRRYNPASAYGQAKLANQAFMVELDRRLRAANDNVVSVGAHPGYTTTGLGSTMAGTYQNAMIRTVLGAGTKAGELLLAQDASMGALPELFAATANGVGGGDYVGPGGLGGVRGHPVYARPFAQARDERAGAALWQLTAELTGITPDPT